MTLIETALALHDAGFCVLPAAHGRKTPPKGIEWRSYQTQRPSREQIAEWFSDPGVDGLGIVCGATSGNAEMLEVEGRFANRLAEIGARATAAGIGQLWRRIVDGYTESTPSGGVHWLLRVLDGAVAGNTRLARDADGEVLIETRGSGGWVILAPSASRSVDKETGELMPDPYVLLLGGPASVAEVTAAERDALHALLASFDETPQRPEPQPALPDDHKTHRNTPDLHLNAPRPDGAITPGDDYEQRASWREILTPHGWIELRTDSAGTTYWQRPNHPDREAISATTGHADDRDRLFVFSTSTPFEPETPYTKLGAVAVLEHGGDHSAAARALASRGYGTPAERIDPWSLIAGGDDRPKDASPHLDDNGEPLSVFEAMVRAEAMRLKVREEATRRVRAELHATAEPIGAQMLDRSQLADLPKPDPIIDRVLMAHSLIVLSGRHGTKKSLVAQSWCASLTTGMDWLGHDVKPQRVLYIAGEGAYGLAARFDAWETAWQRRIPADRLTVLPRSINLFRGGPELDDLVGYVAAGRYGLVVVDTLRRASSGADENAARDMGMVIDALEQIKRATADGSVLAIAHTDKGDNGTRGSSAIEDDADIVWHAEADDYRTLLRNTKMKDGPDGLEINLRAREYEQSIVLEAFVEPILAQIGGLKPSEQQILSIMQTTFSETGATRAELVGVAGEGGMGRTTAFDAINSLIRAGKLALDGKTRVTLSGLDI